MPKETIYTFAKNQIRTNLNKGSHNALTRQNLKTITGLDDRTNRCIIEDLRNEGMPIISYSNGKGYWLPEKVSDVEHFINEFRKRGRECNLKAGLAECWLLEHANELENI